MYNLIQSREAKDRRYYEVILKNLPCKVYLDIDFKVKAGLDGYALVTDLIDYVCFHLSKLYSVSTKDVLVLDSTTSKKFSFHIIINAQTGYFENNEAVGVFVQQIVSLEGYRKFVLQEGGQSYGIIDQSVYSSFRSFRCLENTKLNKASWLKVSKTDKYVSSHGISSQKQIFLQSLVSLQYKGTKKMITKAEVFTAFHGLQKTKRMLPSCRSSLK
jgi:DNA-directed primase/polymerase protein